MSLIDVGTDWCGRAIGGATARSVDLRAMVGAIPTVLAGPVIRPVIRVLIRPVIRALIRPVIRALICPVIRAGDRADIRACRAAGVRAGRHRAQVDRRAEDPEDPEPARRRPPRPVPR
jgi:hypothetical protein